MADASQGVTDIAGIVDIGTALFGSSQSVRGSTSETTRSSGRQTEQIELDEAAIAAIIEDVLGGAEGLASVFSTEQAAGVFDSSVAAQASGDIVSKLVGELAKLTSKKVITQESEAEREASSRTKTKDGGLLGAIKDIF